MLRHRLRCHIRLGDTKATNLANNASGYFDRAVHIREGGPAEERKRLDVVDVGGGFSDVIGDLPLSDETDASDGFTLLANALSDSGSIGNGSDVDPTRPSWVERHTCDHEDDARNGCVVDEFQEGPA